MAIPLALPLAPVLFPGATAAAATFVVGSSVYLANSVYGFRRPVSLPRVTGLEGVATLTEKVADYLAAARVPVGFPVPPQLQDPRAAAAAAGVWLAGKVNDWLAQLWGRVAGPQRSVPISWAEYNNAWQTVAAGSVLSGTFGAIQKGSGTRCTGSPWSVVQNITSTSIAPQSITAWKYSLTILDYSTGMCGGLNPAFSSLSATMRVDYVLTTGTTGFKLINGWNYHSGSTATGTWTVEPNFSGLLLNGSPMQQPEGAIVWANPSNSFDFVPATDGSLPSQTALNPPSSALPEAVPGAEPLTEPNPSTTPLPLLPPVVQPWWWQFPVLEGQPLSNDGKLAPLAPAPATITPTDAHYPVPGGAPVGSIAKAPAATLAAIAVEVGRVEQKLERLLNPLASDNAGDLMRLVWDAAQQIINAQLDNRDGGEYVLSSPCELDANGDRIESTVAYPETEDNFSAVLVRLDALAALLQTHKELKQPICRQTPAVGQPVTVQFVQIE